MSEIEEIVRISGRDINGKKPLKESFREIKGIGANLADSISNVITKELDINKETKVGKLKAKEIDKIEDIIKNPKEYGIPNYLLNRRKDRKTGEDKHLTEADLELQERRDKEFMKSINSYKGVRHKYGLRTRGQRTRTTGRGELSLGVEKEKIKPGKEE